MVRLRRLTPALLALLACAPAFGQTLLFRVEAGNTTQLVTSGGAATVASAAIGAATPVRIGVSYQGALTAVVVRAELAGSRDFAFTNEPPGLTTLRPLDTTGFDVRFTPSSTARSEAQFAVVVRELAADGATILGQTVQLITLTGTVPDLAIFASAEPDPPRRIVSGDSITFPAAAPGLSSTVTLVVGNRGSGAGTLESAAVEGAQFQLSDGTGLPVRLEPGAEVRFALRYVPREAGTHRGVVRAVLDGRTLTATLEGRSSTTPGGSLALRYTRVEGQDSTPIAPGATLDLGAAGVGRRITTVVRVENAGATDTPEFGVSVDGGSFSLLEGPFRTVLRPGAALAVTVAFQSSQPESAEGRLRIGDDAFVLRGTALESELNYRYETEAGSVTASPGGRVFIQPAAAPGSVLRRRFTVENPGNRAVTIPVVQLANGQAGLQIEEAPETPLSLGPGESASFVIRFAPLEPGQTADVLIIGSTTFDVAAVGSRPPAIPDYTITSTLADPAPARQGSVALSLRESYPLPVRGQLALRVISNGAGVDPSVQFASGGRTAGFRIAANTTEAVFDDGGKDIGFQTGTLTGTLVFTPSFQTEGDIDITPAAAPFLALFVPVQPPVLTGARVLDLTTTSLSLVVNGYSSTRSLLRLHIRLQQEQQAPAEFSLDVAGLTATWFTNPAAEQFGGAFSLTIPFTAPRGSTRVQSIEATAENAVGRSNTVTAIVPVGGSR